MVACTDTYSISQGSAIYTRVYAVRVDGGGDRDCGGGGVNSDGGGIIGECLNILE